MGLDKCVGLRSRAVIDRNSKAVVGYVESEVLTHDREADESYIRL